jgi:hypothetical protein
VIKVPRDLVIDPGVVIQLLLQVLVLCRDVAEERGCITQQPAGDLGMSGHVVSSPRPALWYPGPGAVHDAAIAWGRQ